MRFTQAITIAAGLSASLVTAIPIASSTENSKRALVAPFNDANGDGLIPKVGVLVDGVFTTVGTGLEPAVEGGESQPEVNAKRALVAPFSDGEGNGLVESLGQGLDGVITTVAGVVEPVVEGGDSQPEVNA